jgi:Domain of unknown function (DUF5668)/N-terminal domain of toast_rack, DUF2154
MNNRFHRPSLFWPLLFIGLGLLLLLQNFGLLPPGLWEALVPLWPVLLVVLGLDMLVGRRSRGGALLVAGLGAIIVAAALTWAAVRASTLPVGVSQALSQPLQDAQTAQINLDVGMGELNVSALGQSPALMEGLVVLGGGESVQQTFSVVNNEGQLDLVQRQNGMLTPFLARRNAEGAHWNIQLASSIPLTLDIHTGIGQAHLDLSGLKLLRLSLRTGLGQTFVVFPPRGSLRTTVQAGLGEVVLTIPVDLPTRLTVSSGLAAVRIPARFAQQGKVYTANGFGSDNGDYLDLELNAGLGSVTVN